MSTDVTKIAIIYDFDKTLSVSDMQEGFIRSMGLDPKDFWKEVGEYARARSMDSKLAYMYLMAEKSRERNVRIDRETLGEYGRRIEFYDGILEWFKEIDSVAKGHGVEVEHYLISAGLKEIIMGTPIAGHFSRVYACEYVYDDGGRPAWVKNVVNFTSKTQFIFRINKGRFDIWDEEGVNEYMPDDERYCPFGNMIYIGDGVTDIPCMKLVKEYGGHSIGVYSEDRVVADRLMYDERINFVCKADYRKGSEMFRTVSDIIGKTSYGDRLLKQEFRDYRNAEKSCRSKDHEKDSDTD